MPVIYCIFADENSRVSTPAVHQSFPDLPALLASVLRQDTLLPEHFLQMPSNPVSHMLCDRVPQGTVKKALCFQYFGRSDPVLHGGCVSGV